MTQQYSAKDIQVLEGLEPVRKRPGMYIGGTDINALHHLVHEIFDNSMDEAVAGFARNIYIQVKNDGSIIIADDGRGIPTDPHPKYPDKSALEVILTTLHSGGKFNNDVYKTSGGLHGVGISVVNALSAKLLIKIFRDGQIFSQEYSRGLKVTEIESQPLTKKQTGTIVQFYPDPLIFSDTNFNVNRLYKFAKSKAYLFNGTKVHWSTEIPSDNVPTKELLHFPKGLRDYISSYLREDDHEDMIFSGSKNLNDSDEKVEWAIFFNDGHVNFLQSYCNTVPTAGGGAHTNAVKAALLKSLKNFAEIIKAKKAATMVYEDIEPFFCGVVSVFIKEPEFQGQTKDKLVNQHLQKPIENVLKDNIDNWLINNKNYAQEIIEFIEDRINERLLSKSLKEKKTTGSRAKMPLKLADCSRRIAKGAELFLVEGDSAGGSAKQARNREFQAILPLRGKILNVANNSKEKFAANQGLKDLIAVLGCGVLGNYDEEKLRYEKVIIMTDADVDGAHIAALLMTFFYYMMPQLIQQGHLFLAIPPLYKAKIGNETIYLAGEEERKAFMANLKKGKSFEMTRFKGLGEMMAAQLKVTTMDPQSRKLARISINDDDNLKKVVSALMGNDPEKRLEFIQKQINNFIDEIKEEVLS